MTFHQEEQMLPKSWILLENQSMVDVFCNRSLLTNVRESNKIMNIRCNAGVTHTNMVGELNGYGTVWYNPRQGNCKHPIIVSSREETPCDIRQRSIESVCHAIVDLLATVQPDRLEKIETRTWETSASEHSSIIQIHTSSLVCGRTR